MVKVTSETALLGGWTAEHCDWGTMAIIEEVHGGVLPVSSSPVTWVQAVWRGAVSTLQTLFCFLMKAAEGTLGETTCQLCGNRICKVSAVFLSSTELSKDLNPMGKGHHPNSPKKVRKGEPLPRGRRNAEGKPVARKGSHKPICQSSSSSSLVSSEQSSHCRPRPKVRYTTEEHQDSGPMKFSSRSHAQKKCSRGRIISRFPCKILNSLLHVRRKTCQLDNLYTLVPGPTGSTANCQENSDTWSLSSSVCSLSSVEPSEESFHIHVSYPSFVQPKLIFKGQRSVISRGRCLPFLEQDDICNLEQNLRHKQRMFFWRLHNHHTNAMAMMAPKATPLPLLIKSSETSISFKEKETHFVKSTLSEGLEFHVQRKMQLPDEKLPAMLKKSLTDFMPPVLNIHPTQDREESFCSEGQLCTTSLKGGPSSIISPANNDDLEAHVDKECTELKVEVLPSLVKESQSMLFEDIKPPLSTMIIRGSKCLQPSLCQLEINKQDEVEHVDRMPSKHSLQISEDSRISAMEYKDTNQDTHTAQDKVALTHLHKDPNSNMSTQDKHQLQLDLTKACLEIQRELLAPVVRTSEENVYLLNKEIFPKLYKPGERHLQSRATFFLFIDQISIDAIEWNLKQEHLLCRWVIQPTNQVNLKECMPNSSSLPSLIAGRSENIEFSGMETHFLKSKERKHLEWHILRKVMHCEWGLPTLPRRSLQAFRTLAPGLTRTKTSPDPDIEIAMIRDKTFFIFKATRKYIELHAKKRIINHNVGLPSKILECLAKFPLTAPLDKELPSQQVGEVPASSVKVPDLPMSATSITEPKVDDKSMDPVVQSRKDMGGISKLYKCAPVQRRPHISVTLEIHLTKKYIETQIVALPSVVWKSQVLSLSKKIFLSQFIRLGKSQQKPRVSVLTCMDPASLQSLECNLNHKLLAYLWGLPTRHLHSYWNSNPKTSFIPVLLQASETSIEFLGIRAPFMKPGYLEWHVKKKTLQHEWGMPAFIHTSLQTFMSSAPMPIQHRNCLKPAITLIIISVEASFVNEDTRTYLENHVKQRIIQNAFGLPQKILETLRMLHHVPPPFHVFLAEEETISGLSFASPGQTVPGKKVHKLKTLKSSMASGNLVVSALDQLQIMEKTNLQIHLGKKFLEMHMEMILVSVERSMKAVYFLMKQTLPKRAYPGKMSIESRNRVIPFIDPKSLHSLERNMKLKHLIFLWGALTLQKGSLPKMIPKVLPLPKAHKGSGTGTGFDEMTTTFLKPKTRECLEWHVESRKLYQQWNLPRLVHKSLQAFVPPAPKLESLQMKVETRLKFLNLTGDLFFMTEYIQRNPEKHVKKIVQKEIGLPLRIIDSLKSFVCTPSMSKVLIHCDDLNPILGCSSPSVQTGEGFMGNYINVMTYTSHLHENTGFNMVTFLQKYKDEILHQMSWRVLGPTLKPTLPKLVQMCERCVQTRRRLKLFVEQDTIDCIQRNIRHKHIMFLWGLSAPNTDSVFKMILQAKHLSQQIHESRAATESSEVDTFFVKPVFRQNLEWHIKVKKLQHECGLPTLLHRSLKSFMSPIPPCVPPNPSLKLKDNIQLVSIREYAYFLSKDKRKHLENHIKKRIVQQIFGLPLVIVESLKGFTPIPPVEFRDLPQTEGIKTAHHQAKTSGITEHPNRLTTYQQDVGMGCIEHIETNMSRKKEKGTELRLGVVGSLVRKSHDWAFLEKTPLPKFILPGDKGIQTRPSDFPHMESAAVRKINLNLKQKKLAFLWGLPSQQTQLMFTILPKPSSLDPPVKPSGATIEFSQVETPFISCEFRLHMEWHIKKKRLQQKCRIPPDVQKSIKAFIPSPQEIFGSQIHKNSDLEVIPLTSKLLFIDENTQEELEFHIRKLIVQERYGLSDKIKADLRKCVLPSPSTTEQAPDEDINPLANVFPQVSKTLQAKKGSSGSQKTLLPLKCALPIEESQRNKKLEQHLTRKCLEVKMGLLPFVVEWSSRIACPTEKTHLPKQIFSKQNCQQRVTRGFFLQPENVHQVDLNIKHKQLMSLLGLTAHSIEPLNNLMPTALFLIPQFQTKGFCIEFSEMDTPFICSKDRETLEWHVKKKCLHRDWDLPVKIQRSLTVFMQQAPKQLQLRPSQRAATDLIIKSGDILFLNETTKQILEKHIISLKRHPRMTCPKKIAEAFKLFKTTAPESKPSAYALDSNKPSRPQSLLQLCFKKSIKITPPSKHVPLSPEKEVQHPKLLFGRSASRHAGEKDGLLPRGVQQQQLENKLESSTVGSLISNQLAQSVKVLKDRYMTWKNRKRKLLLNSLPPKIHTTLENEDITHCHGLTQKLPTSENNNEPCMSEPTLGISTMNENQIMHNMQTPFMRQKLRKWCPCAPQKNWDHGTPLPFQSSQCMCLDCPCSMSDRPAHEPPKPFSFPALKTPDGSMADVPDAILQSSCDGQDSIELTIQSGQQSVRREMESDCLWRSRFSSFFYSRLGSFPSILYLSLGLLVFLLPFSLLSFIKVDGLSHSSPPQCLFLGQWVYCSHLSIPRRKAQFWAEIPRRATINVISNPIQSRQSPRETTSIYTSSKTANPVEPSLGALVFRHLSEDITRNLKAHVQQKKTMNALILSLLMGKDEVPRRTRKMQKAKTQTKRKADVAHPTQDIVQPPRTITAQPSPGDRASREHGRRKEKSNMAGSLLGQTGRAHPEENRERKGTRKARTKADKVPATPADKDGPNNSHTAEEGTTSSAGVEVGIWKTQCSINTHWRTCSSSRRNMLPDASSTSRPYLIEETDTSSAGAWGVIGQVDKVEHNKYRGRGHSSRRVEHWVEPLSLWPYRYSNMAQNKPLRRKGQRQHQSIPRDISLSRHGPKSRQINHCRVWPRRRAHHMQERYEAPIGTKDSVQELPSNRASANSAEQTNCETKFIFLHYLSFIYLLIQ